MGELLDTKMNLKELENRIKRLKQWLNHKQGLNLPVIMDILLDPFKSNLTEEEIKKFFEGIEILRKTNYPNIDKRYNNSVILHGDIIKYGKIIRGKDGKYNFLNKLDTNYSQLSHLICYLLEQLMDDNDSNFSDLGRYFYNKITQNLESGLLEFRNELINVTNRYLKTQDDYEKLFIDELVNTSNVGDYSESLVRDYLLENGFIIVYNGYNGDFIDKIYGVDFIAFHPVYGYKTIQVKHKLFDLEKTFGRYKNQGIDIGIIANNKEFKVYDLQNNYNFVELLNVRHIVNLLSLKKSFIKDDGLYFPINKTDIAKLLYVKKIIALEENNDIYNISFNYKNDIKVPHICFIDDENVYIFDRTDSILEVDENNIGIFKIQKNKIIIEELD